MIFSDISSWTNHWYQLSNISIVEISDQFQFQFPIIHIYIGYSIDDMNHLIRIALLYSLYSGQTDEHAITYAHYSFT